MAGTGTICDLLDSPYIAWYSRSSRLLPGAETLQLLH
jgi:hypothetical protein